MADDQKIAMPMDVDDECSTKQPPKDDAVACPEQPSNDDGAAYPPEEEAGPSSRANGLDNTNKVIVNEDEQNTSDGGNTNYDNAKKRKKNNEEKKNKKIKKLVRPVFAPGLVPDRIAGASESNGKLLFLVLFKNSEETDLIESTVMYEFFREITCKFLFPDTHECVNVY